MKILFVADGRSPIARNWIRYFIVGGSDVHLISTFVSPTLPGLRSQRTISVAFSGLSRGSGNGVLTSSRTIGLRTLIRHWLGPATVGNAARQASDLTAEIEPDLIHAMRIPFEGAVASALNTDARILLSIWGNDFTLHAPSSPMMRSLTRRTLSRASALHTDNRRDVDLAAEWGFVGDRPHLVLPGNGGVRREIFFPGEPGPSEHPALTRILDSLEANTPVVVNPRGFRAYVRNDSFFMSIPRVLEKIPSAVFLCPGMAGQKEAEQWIDKLQIQNSVVLLPKLMPTDLGVAFRRAQVSVSPSEHDGTPNTLLEAMACGAYPVVGDLPSIREWIEDGKNGTLVDPASADQIAEGIAHALEGDQMREQAQVINMQLIEQRADYERGMKRAEAFYGELLG